MPKDDFKFHCTVRVRWSEGDPQGIVYNARYFDYIEVAQVEYFRNLGIMLYATPGMKLFSRLLILDPPSKESTSMCSLGGKTSRVRNKKNNRLQ